MGIGLAISDGDPEPGEAGLVADSATIALREAQPDIRIEVLSLIEAMAEPITEVVTVQTAAVHEPLQHTATKPLGRGVYLSPLGFRPC